MIHRSSVLVSPLDSIERFARQGVTGELSFRSDALEATVFLQAGRLAFATSSRSTFSIGRELARRASVAPDILRDLVQSCRRDGIPLARGLADSGLVPTDVMRDVLVQQIRHALETLIDEVPALPAFTTRDRGAVAYPPELTFAFDDVSGARKARRPTTAEFRPPDLRPSPTLALVPEPPPSRRTDTMASLKDTLNKILEIDGAIGCCAVDSNSGMMLGSAGGGSSINLEVAAAGNTEVVRAKRKTMKALGLADAIDDILITLGRQYHIIRPLGSNDALFIYLVLDKQRGNLAMARHQLAALERDLSL